MGDIHIGQKAEPGWHVANLTVETGLSSKGGGKYRQHIYIRDPYTGFRIRLRANEATELINQIADALETDPQPRDIGQPLAVPATHRADMPF